MGDKILESLEMKEKRQEIKPPIGVCPKDIWERNNKVKRLNDIREAIARYYDAGLKIKVEWIEEYNELIESLQE